MDKKDIPEKSPQQKDQESVQADGEFIDKEERGERGLEKEKIPEGDPKGASEVEGGIEVQNHERIEQLREELTRDDERVDLESVEQEVVFVPIPDSRAFQKQMRALTISLEAQAKQRGIAIPRQRQLRREGRSTVDMNQGLFSYFFTNYEMARRYLAEYSRLKGERQGMNVLEIGSGVGWGARFLSDSLSEDIPDLRVVATNRVTNEVDQATLHYAKSVYGKGDKLRFEQADALNLIETFGENKFDAVVMLETIEHLPRDARDQCMQQVSLLLEKSGLLLMSAPSLEGHGITRSQRQNDVHVWVYGNRQDFEALVSPHFSNTQVNRLVNRQQIKEFGVFGERTLKARLKQLPYQLGIKRPPDSVYENYRYVLGKPETDKVHQKVLDTHTWFVVAQKG